MIKSIAPTNEMTALRNDIIAVCNKHGEMDATHMLATLSYTVGQMIALQDQRKYTAGQIMELVSSNIEAGNAAVVYDFMKKPPEGKA